MNVRIFWVCAMKCMYAQTRPRFILSCEGVFGGMEFEPMLTPREKSPLPENVPRGGSNPRRCGQWAQALPTELFRPPRLVIWGPQLSSVMCVCVCVCVCMQAEIIPWQATTVFESHKLSGFSVNFGFLCAAVWLFCLLFPVSSLSSFISFTGMYCLDTLSGLWDLSAGVQRHMELSVLVWRHE